MVRTIEFVLNKDDGSTIYADHFFSKEENEVFKYRNELQKAIKGIREPLFVCYFCGQKIKINGGGQTKKVLHFAHRKDSDICHLKTDTNHSSLEINRLKYNGAKESPLHFETKNLIKQFIDLNSDFSNIKVESVVKSNTNYLEWKKPDISAIYRGINVVFEIQLSTTFLSVIVDREHFYKENQRYILWVFKNFELDEFKQRFTEKDVFYSNNRNAFVLDNESINLSLKNNDLYLLCYYQKPIIEDLKIKYNWESEYVCFNQLIFDDLNYKIFYFDVELEENKITIELQKIEEEQRIFVAEKKRKQREKARELSEERFQIAKEYIEVRNERVNFLRKKELYSAERQIAINERHNLFREINEDFFIRLKENYQIRSDFKDVFYTPEYELSNELNRLFINGYRLSETDRMFLRVEFNFELNKKSKLREMEILYYLSLSTFYIKLKNPKYMFLLPKVERLLCSILSFKTGKIIGYSFDNLIQVAHHTFSKKEHIQIFLNAIEAYYGLGLLLSQDKNKKFRNKLLEYQNNKPEQSTQYDEMIKMIFPEAINNIVNVEKYV
ncbi:DUF6035 family protein [Flavobacterium gyeonganense]|uniref:DUF6035 family protein n=1 Tax=Flavobacterium gyeonganense TaxID=1310418 RepID=A0ABV5H8E4_9FLAO|nr:DUF6035 family protein [Flavobacterium gyeonganense]